MRALPGTCRMTVAGPWAQQYRLGNGRIPPAACRGGGILRLVHKEVLMKKDLLVKERYGKVYLTENGVLIAQELQHRIDILESELKNFSFSLTQEEIHRMAILITTEMPDVQIGESSFFKAEG